MSQSPTGQPVPTRADELHRAQQKRQQRAFIGFALVEGLVLVLAVIIIYVLELIDPAVGVWLLMAIALVGGGLLSAYLVTSIRRNQRELAELSDS